MRIKASTVWLLVFLTVALSALYYALLMAELMWFPQMSGHSFSVDWPQVVTALAPVIILLLLILVTQFSSIQASVGAVKVKFLRGVPFSENNAVMLDATSVRKGGTSDLQSIVERIRVSDHKPRILMVLMSPEQGQHVVEFAALRDYVFEISQVAPLRFIVFADEAHKYLGFMEVGDFIRRDPKLPIESLVDIARNRQDLLILIQALRPVLEVRAEISLERLLSAIVVVRDYARSEATRIYWDAKQQNVWADQLRRLSARPIHLVRPTVSKAYAFMKANRVDAVPVTDGNRGFVGMATMESVVQDVIAQLLPGQARASSDGTTPDDSGDILTSRRKSGR
jgi:CBS domain containing-hemolysin-like protein